MVRYTDTLESVLPSHLRGGFFERWPNPPSPETHLRILQNSDEVVLALDGSGVVGFVAAITDGVLCAHVPLLEVLPAYRGRGVGSGLARRMLGTRSTCSATPTYNRSTPGSAWSRPWA